MDDFNLIRKQLKKEFVKHGKRIIRHNKTQNPKTRFKYMREAIESYNKYITEVNNLFDKLGYQDQAVVREDFLYFKSQVLKYIGSYNLNNFPEPKGGYDPVKIDDDQLLALCETGLIRNNTPNSSDDENSHSDEPSGSSERSIHTEAIMSTDISKLDFINACSRQIPSNYDGNFETLRSFINKINFLKELASTAELRNTLKVYILTKLDQKALAKVSEDPASVDEIIASLKNKIKHDNSKVLEGRMTALTLDNKPFSDFQSQAKILAESYQQSLIEEGIPLQVAEKLAIEKTVDLCRKNTRSSEVKAILSASEHPDTASVIAKMVTGIDAVRQEKLINDGKSKAPHKNTNRGRGQNRGRGHQRPPGNNRNGNGYGSQNGSQQGNQSGNGRGNFNRGRGRGRGGNGHHGNNGNGRGGGHYNQQFYQNGYPDQQVLYNQGNGQMLPMGAQQQNSNQNSQRM